MVSLTFDSTFEGFLSVVHAVYYEKIEPISVSPEGFEQLSLNEPPHFIATDENAAARVFRAIREKISEESAEYIFYAFLARDEDRFMPILRYIRLGFKISHMVDSHLHEDFVRRVQKLAKQVGREAHLLYGFCRFVETAQGVFYCPVTPKNDVLILLAQHFSRRMMNQPWVIHDKSRNKAAIYDGKSFLITAVPRDVNITLAEHETETRELWVTFFKTLAIKERENPKLQRQLMPLYFRKNMTEFA